MTRVYCVLASRPYILHRQETDGTRVEGAWSQLAVARAHAAWLKAHEPNTVTEAWVLAVDVDEPVEGFPGP